MKPQETYEATWSHKRPLQHYPNTTTTEAHHLPRRPLPSMPSHALQIPNWAYHPTPRHRHNNTAHRFECPWLQLIYCSHLRRQAQGQQDTRNKSAHDARNADGAVLCWRQVAQRINACAARRWESKRAFRSTCWGGLRGLNSLDEANTRVRSRQAGRQAGRKAGAMLACRQMLLHMPP